MRSPMGQRPQQPDTVQTDREDGEQSHFRHNGNGSQGSQRGGSLRQKGGLGMLLRRAEEFNLTPEQEEQLVKKRTEFELEKVDLRAALSRAQIKFRALIRDIDSAEQDVMNAIDEVAKCEADLRKMRYRHLKETHSVLDDDQRNGFKTFFRKQKREKVQALRAVKRGASG